jgi:hypothetical protein
MGSVDAPRPLSVGGKVLINVAFGSARPKSTPAQCGGPVPCSPVPVAWGSPFILGVIGPSDRAANKPQCADRSQW